MSPRRARRARRALLICAALFGLYWGAAVALQDRCPLCSHPARPMDFIRRVELPTARPTSTTLNIHNSQGEPLR